MAKLRPKFAGVLIDWPAFLVCRQCDGFRKWKWVVNPIHMPTVTLIAKACHRCRCREVVITNERTKRLPFAVIKSDNKKT